MESYFLELIFRRYLRTGILRKAGGCVLGPEFLKLQGASKDLGTSSSDAGHWSKQGSQVVGKLASSSLRSGFRVQS